MPGYAEDAEPSKVGAHLLTVANASSFSSYHPVYKGLTGGVFKDGIMSEMRLAGGMPLHSGGNEDVAAILVPLSPFDSAEALVGRSDTNTWTDSGFTVVANDGRDAAAKLESGAGIKSVMVRIMNATADDDCIGTWKSGVLVPIRGTETSISTGGTYPAGHYNEITVNNLAATLEAGAFPSESGPLRNHRLITLVAPYHLNYVHEPGQYTFGAGDTYARPMLAMYLTGLNKATYDGLTVEVIYYGVKVPSTGAASVLGFSEGYVPEEELARISYAPVHSFGR